MSHLTLGATSRSFVLAVIFIWTDSSFLVFPLKCHSLTRPQHSSSLCKVSWILFVVMFCFYNTRVIFLKCQGCFPIQSCLFIWFLCLSRTEAHRLFWESDETLSGFPRKVICNIGTNKFCITCPVHGAPKPLCSLVLRAIDFIAVPSSTVTTRHVWPFTFKLVQF